MELYNNFSSARLDAERWQVGAIPLGDGEYWHYRDDNAKVECGGGHCRIEIPRFSMHHDQVQILDNPKYLYMATYSWPTSYGVAVFKTRLAGQVTGDPDDYRDGFASFNVLDLNTGMVFDIATNGTHVWAIYERLLIPGVTTPGEAFTEAIDLKVETEPLREHVLQVTYDRAGGRVHYAVDGRERAMRENLPVVVQQLTAGFGLITLQPITDGKSISCKGQGGECRIGPIYVSA